MPETPPIVLSIAGFDPSSGAGVTADIKTIAALGCYGVSAITALTVQSTAGVRRVVPVEPELLTDSLEELTRDVKVSAVHIGMLGNQGIAAAVAEFISRARLRNVVLDPILVSSSGARLLDDGGLQVLTGQLLPLADVITPNIDEAAALTGREVKNPEQMTAAAERLHEMGSKAVVITGGHLDPAIDVLSIRGQASQVFRADRLGSANTHGTGCAFSTAIACYMALDCPLSTAVSRAKNYVFEAIRNSYSIGKGPGPVNHMHEPKKG
ncbi:MAG TPA: bifunctional hydroxymethylpyrimidine kinase/phosphomethylpyrimidine kinase [Terriglobales bacterium]|nr:bifunctional hydroxymethylpyrimidine kinase/phosphomethylpyrimidine kinase [Terriglobales bacterium]